MTQRNRWTDEEDKVLVQAIKASPHNKSAAFQKVARKTNHNVNSCSTRWYNVLSNPEHKKYVGCMYTTIGITRRLDNRTVSRKKSHITPVKVKKSLWNRLKELLGL